MTHENNHNLRAHLAGFMLHLEHFTVFPVYKKKTTHSHVIPKARIRLCTQTLD